MLQSRVKPLKSRVDLWRWSLPRAWSRGTGTEFANEAAGVDECVTVADPCRCNTGLHGVGEGHRAAVGDKQDPGLIRFHHCLHSRESDIQKAALLFEVSLLLLW